MPPSLQDAMVMGADYYESDEQRAQLLAAGQVPVGVGANTTLQVSTRSLRLLLRVPIELQPSQSWLPRVLIGCTCGVLDELQ